MKKFVFVAMAFGVSFCAWAMTDTEAPVPPQIQDDASITVATPPGPYNDYGYYYLKVCSYSQDKHGRPILRSAKNCSVQGFDEKIKLPAGHYVITLGNTSAQFVDLGAHEQKTISLVKLTVPKIDGSYKYTVFVDVSAPTSQDMVMKTIWLQGGDMDGDLVYANTATHENYDPKEICQYHTPGAVRLCRAFRSGDYRNLRNSQVRFYPDATLNGLMFGGSEQEVWAYRDVGMYINNGRMTFAIGHDGESILVFSGVYGISYESSGGHRFDRLGVMVNPEPN